MKAGKSVWLLLVDDDDRVLVVKRSKAVNNPGKWCLPGGHYKRKPNRAIRKEIFEEVGLNIKPSYVFKKRVDVKIHRYFIAKFNLSKHNIVLNYEASKYKWVPLSKLSKLENVHRSIKYLGL